MTVTLNRDGTKPAIGETCLQALSTARIFDIERNEDGTFCISEACDHYFWASLTQEQMLMLSDEIRALAMQPVDKVSQ